MKQLLLPGFEEEDKFIKHLKWATKIVKSWPEWKQNILKYSSQSERSIPRQVIYETR